MDGAARRGDAGYGFGEVGELGAQRVSHAPKGKEMTDPSKKEPSPAPRAYG